MEDEWTLTEIPIPITSLFNGGIAEPGFQSRIA